jgi:hypothetical protein
MVKHQPQQIAVIRPAILPNLMPLVNKKFGFYREIPVLKQKIAIVKMATCNKKFKLKRLGIGINNKERIQCVVTYRRSEKKSEYQRLFYD